MRRALPRLPLQTRHPAGCQDPKKVSSPLLPCPLKRFAPQPVRWFPLDRDSCALADRIRHPLHRRQAVIGIRSECRTGRRGVSGLPSIARGDLGGYCTAGNSAGFGILPANGSGPERERGLVEAELKMDVGYPEWADGSAAAWEQQRQMALASGLLTWTAGIPRIGGSTRRSHRLVCRYGETTATE